MTNKQSNRYSSRRLKTLNFQKLTRLKMNKKINYTEKIDANFFIHSNAFSSLVILSVFLC